MSNVRLTPKGERWLANVIGYGSATLIIIGFLAAWGFAGWLEAL